jgi:hypothetical protein
VEEGSFGESCVRGEGGPLGVSVLGWFVGGFVGGFAAGLGVGCFL